MKKYFLRTLLFAGLVILISIFLNRIIYPSCNLVPWTYGSELLEAKRSELMNKPGQFNTLIIGSSRVYRQVNPVLMDSLTKLKTYNLGINWLFAPESFYVFEQLVTTDKLPFKCVIIELSKIRSIDYENLHTSRIKYWYTFSNYFFSVKSVAASNFALHEKIATILAHSISYLDELINLGYLTEAFSFKTRTFHNASEKGHNGFLPLSVSGEVSGEENTAERNKRFLNDTSVVTLRKNNTIKQFEKFEHHPELLKKYNHVYLKEINEMIANAESKGIDLIFLLSPRIDEKQYNELIPLFNQIDKDHRIELADGRKYPELYSAFYSFDETHLNQKGADVYTTLLSQKLREILK